MGFIELFILAVALSMDAFAVSVCKGLSAKRATIGNMTTCGAWFGGFQGLMPLIGFFLGSLFASAIVAIDHWVAFILLAIIGANMVKEAFAKEEETDDGKNADFSVKTMFTMAVATSIDALAVGVSLAMAGNVNIWVAVIFIALVTFTLSAVGVKVGTIFGSKFENKAQLAGGLILIGLGLKILIQGLLEK